MSEKAKGIRTSDLVSALEKLNGLENRHSSIKEC